MAWMGIVSLIAIIFVVSYWLIRPYSILELKPGNAEVLTPVVKSGGYLQIRENYKKNMKMIAVIDCTFNDGVVYQIPQTTSSREVGEEDTVEYKYIPKALPIGTYTLTCIYSYHPNPLRTINYRFQTTPFVVEAK